MTFTTVGPHYDAIKALAYGRTFNESVLDRVDPEMRPLVADYWGQYPPVDSLWYGILIFVMCILTMIAISGNVMVIYIFSTTKALRTPSNLLVINLAISDFCLIFFMAPPMIVNCYYENWVFGPLFCYVYAMFGSMFGCASIWTMCAIAYDRYNIIVKGLAAKPMTTGTAIFYIFGVWAISSIWTAAPILGWGRYRPEGNLTTCGSDYFTLDADNISYLTVYTWVCYFLPLKLIMWCYWYIIQAVHTHEKNMREQAKKMNVASLRQGDSSNLENKLAKICLVTVSLWFMAWTPYLIICIMGMCNIGKLTPTYSIWGAVFAKANSTYNPIVYGISHPKYRAALHARFPSLSCADPPPPAVPDAISTVSAVASEHSKPAA